MLKLFTTVIFSMVLVLCANPLTEKSKILDSRGQLILMKGDDVSLMMGQCRSLRISKTPPLVPRLKCRFS